MEPGNWSLLFGPVPVVVTVAGAVGLLWVLWDRRRVWWTRVVPIAAGAVVALVVAGWLLVDVVWRPFPDPTPTAVLLWSGVALFAVALAVPRVRRGRWPARVSVVLAALLVITASAAGINQHFGLYPSVRALAGLFRTPGVDPGLYVGKPTGAVDLREWTPPAGMPANGALFRVDIPSSGGFTPRPGWVWVPPAYRTTPRPALPVLVLLGGQPGSPRDWIDAGELEHTMDAYTAKHDGLAPVIVMADHLGSTMANPMCLDSRLGATETYLTRDVPAWITTHLEVDADRSKWTVAGFSMGGTCAIQLAVRAPQVYGNFIDISGQNEPTLGGRDLTVDRAFGGDKAAYAAVNPLDIMARTRFPDTAGVVVAGANDHDYLASDRQVFEAARRAGMDVQWREYPGGHDWTVWRRGLYDQLPWIAARTGLAVTR